MKRAWQARFMEEEGYTLVETLVAMALFLSVLIPLGVAIGTLLLDREAEKTTKALLIAESEMTCAVLDSDIGSRQFDAGGGFLVRREVRESNSTRDILILIIQQKHPGKTLVKLHKTVVQVP